MYLLHLKWQCQCSVNVTCLRRIILNIMLNIEQKQRIFQVLYAIEEIPNPQNFLCLSGQTNLLGRKYNKTYTGSLKTSRIQ